MVDKRSQCFCLSFKFLATRTHGSLGRNGLYYVGFCIAHMYIYIYMYYMYIYIYIYIYVYIYIYIYIYQVILNFKFYLSY